MPGILFHMHPLPTYTKSNTMTHANNNIGTFFRTNMLDLANQNIQLAIFVFLEEKKNPMNG